MPSKFGYVGQHVTYNKYRNFFLEKNIAKIEVTGRNKGIPRNWYIFVSSAIRTLIFHILPPETCSLNISKNVPKICEVVACFPVTSSFTA